MQVHSPEPATVSGATSAACGSLRRRLEIARLKTARLKLARLVGGAGPWPAAAPWAAHRPYLFAVPRRPERPPQAEGLPHGGPR